MLTNREIPQSHKIKICFCINTLFKTNVYSVKSVLWQLNSYGNPVYEYLLYFKYDLDEFGDLEWLPEEMIKDFL